MARILADHENLAVASDDLALVAHLLDRRTYLHDSFLSVMRFYSIFHAQPQTRDFTAENDAVPTTLRDVCIWFKKSTNFEHRKTPSFKTSALLVARFDLAHTDYLKR